MSARMKYHIELLLQSFSSYRDGFHHLSVSQSHHWCKTYTTFRNNRDNDRNTSIFLQHLLLMQSFLCLLCLFHRSVLSLDPIARQEHFCSPLFFIDSATQTEMQSAHLDSFLCRCKFPGQMELINKHCCGGVKIILMQKSVTL